MYNLDIYRFLSSYGIVEELLENIELDDEALDFDDKHNKITINSTLANLHKIKSEMEKFLKRIDSKLFEFTFPQD